MARTARTEDSGAPNVIDLARARMAQEARRAVFRWPVDGPHPERIAEAALESTAAEAALVAADGTVLAVNRQWVLEAPHCLPGSDFFSAWQLSELDPRDAAQLITGVRSALRSTNGYAHEFLRRDGWFLFDVTPLGGSSGGAVVTVHPRRGPDATNLATPSDGDRARVVRRVTLEHDLRLAVEQGGLRLAYQPQVDVHTGAVQGAEALVRWQHEVYGNVPPSEFVPIAEATGVIRGLGEWVLDEACRSFAGWKAAGVFPGVVTVNLSPLQLTDASLVPRVRSTLAANALAPHELCLELTEGALVSSPDEGFDALCALRAIGVSVALDDFGTGQSSLGRLKALPVDVVKLDRSFIDGLGSNRQDHAIVAAVTALAAALGLRTVAEGVEHQVQAERLLDLGCRVVQGWLYSPAVDAEQFAALCRNGFAPLATTQISRSRADEARMASRQKDPIDG